MAGTEFLLYATPVSVYACKVRLALALKGLDWAEAVPPGGYGSAEYRRIVAQGTVPALDHGGFVLAESDTIIEYLDEIGAGPALLPAEPQARARARELSRMIDTRLEPAARALFALVGTDTSVPDRARGTLRRHLDTLDALAGPGPFLGGARPGMPDCGLWAVAAVLAMLTRSLRLDMAPPRLAQMGDTLPAAAPHLAAYRAALDSWAHARGART